MKKDGSMAISLRSRRCHAPAGLELYMLKLMYPRGMWFLSSYSSTVYMQSLLNQPLNFAIIIYIYKLFEWRNLMTNLQVEETEPNKSIYFGLAFTIILEMCVIDRDVDRG